MAPTVVIGSWWLYAKIVDRQPTRINPQIGSGESRIVTFRDGPQLLPDVFAGLADVDEYPDLTYQEWIHRVANRKIEARIVGQALSSARVGHLVR